MANTVFTFVACETCRERAGYCSGCLANRETIRQLSVGYHRLWSQLSHNAPEYTAMRVIVEALKLVRGNPANNILSEPGRATTVVVIDGAEYDLVLTPCHVAEDALGDDY